MIFWQGGIWEPDCPCHFVKLKVHDGVGEDEGFGNGNNAGIYSRQTSRTCNRAMQGYPAANVF